MIAYMSAREHPVVSMSNASWIENEPESYTSVAMKLEYVYRIVNEFYPYARRGT